MIRIIRSIRIAPCVLDARPTVQLSYARQTVQPSHTVNSVELRAHSVMMAVRYGPASGGR